MSESQIFASRSVRVVCGIDPGISGAVAFLTETGELVAVEDMPTIVRKVGKTLRSRVSPHALGLMLESRLVVHVFCEAPHAMPTNGSSANFVLGHSLGVIEGTVATIRTPITLLAPATWKRAIGLSSDKGTSRARAMQLWPAHAGLFKRVKDDGRAEAALIAWHGIMQSRKVAS